MKKMLKAALLGVVIMLTASCGAQTVREATREVNMAEAIEDGLTRGDFRINVSDLQRGRNISLSSGYYLSISDGQVDSYMPYVGKAYAIPYGGGEGLIFRTTISDYSYTPGKRGSYDVRFTARTNQDIYVFNIQLFTNGRAYLTVVPQNKQNINYTGLFDVPEL